MYTHFINGEKIQNHLIELIEYNSTDYNEEKLLELYTDMYWLRVFEEKCYENYKKHMRGFLHLTIGQECIYIAIKNICRPNDIFIGSYRDHALAYISGSSLQEITYELLGKKLGMCKGKGGSMHLYNKKLFGGHGIVGAQVPLATGLAFAVQYLKQDKRVFCFLGDGAMNQGQVYESFNLALKFNLPIIYVIENNEYGMWTKWCDVTKTDNFYKRWNEMRGIRIKDNSIFTIIDVMSEAYKMSQDGPIVVQIDTYRKCGHSMKDEEKYRNKEEKEQKEKEDCINAVKDILHRNGLAKKIDQINKEIENRCENYFKNAIESEESGKEELMTDILL